MNMTEYRVSISPEIEETIKAAAEEAGKTVSEWLTALAQDRAAGMERTKREKARAEADEDRGYLAALELVEEYEAKYGPIPEEHWREARAIAESMAADDANGVHDEDIYEQRAVGQ